MSRDAASAFARALVDEWARAGVAVAALGPGSRSAPLALALAGDHRIRLEVFIDERSAAYFALGAAKASGRPAVVLTTSGTAATLVHPAVVEAHHARVPLLACTADRPPELRATGASQSIDQLKLFGDAVRWFVEVGVAEDVPGAGRYWRSIASRAAAEALGPPAGPVHLNLAFREPLVPLGEPLVDAPGRPEGVPWVTRASGFAMPDAVDVERLARSMASTARGLIVAGWGAGVAAEAVGQLAAVAGWPVLADAVSGVRAGPLAISTYDALLRHPPFASSHRPALVLRLGAAPTGRAASEWLDASVRQVIVDPDGAWLDPRRVATERVVADPAVLVDALTGRLSASRPAGSAGRRSGWLEGWLAAEAAARRAIDDLLDSWTEPFEGRVARDLVGGLPEGATLVVGSSMPVRDLESFAPARPGLRVLANRGASGIDGFVSTVLGVAAASTASTASVAEGDGAPSVAALAGDLTLLHDLGGLLGATRRGLDATVVVLDNDGGGIFSFLPYAGGPDFERLFGTPHGTDLVEVAAALGVGAVRVTRAGDVVPAVQEALARGGLRLVVVPTDRADNVARHAEAWAAVARALS